MVYAWQQLKLTVHLKFKSDHPVSRTVPSHNIGVCIISDPNIFKDLTALAVQGAARTLNLCECWLYEIATG